MTFSAVEKPGSKIRLTISWSVRLIGADECRARCALARILSRCRPPPSSPDLDHDAAGLVVGIELDRALGGFAGGRAHVGRLDAVVHGVAHQVHQRIADFFDHGLVEFGFRRR